MAEILKGAAVVAALSEKMKADIGALAEKGIIPKLALLRVGAREDDLSYERTAIKRCEAVGVITESIVLPADVPQEELLGRIQALNNDKSVHGILVFRPLPKHIDDEAVRKALSPEKDIDGITDGSLAGVFTLSGSGFAPCTAQACMEILDYYGIDCKGKRVTVIGRSLVVGKPVSIMLLAKHATVTICHTRTADIASAARNAEILVVAAGKAGAVTGEYLSPGQIVIDVGINWDDSAGKLVGDVNFDDAEQTVAAITPVPGGVGTVTTSVLVSHVVEAAKRSC